MRRLSLVCAAVLLGLVAFAGPVQATSPSGARDASLRQAGNPDDPDGDGVNTNGDGLGEDGNGVDQCPTQFGSVRAHGCPDGDGDGVANGVDRCPTLKGFAKTGCPGFRVHGNGFLQDDTAIFIEGTACDCVAVLELTRASERKLHVHSALIGRFPFVHDCGHGARCAREMVGSTLEKKAKAYTKAYFRKHSDFPEIGATMTVRMTSPFREKVTKHITLKYRQNGEQYQLCDKNYAENFPGSRCGRDVRTSARAASGR